MSVKDLCKLQNDAGDNQYLWNNLMYVEFSTTNSALKIIQLNGIIIL